MAVNNKTKTRRIGRWRKGETGNPHGRPKGAVNKASREVREFCRGLLERPAYQKQFLGRWESGQLPPQLEVMVWHYAHGRPVQAVDLNMTFDPAKYLAREEEADHE